MTEQKDIAAHIPRNGLKRVVIIGGGFAGINIARELRKGPFQVVMLDRHNYHTFQPLLYQVATAGLEPDSIAGPLRKIIENRKNFYFRLARVEAVVPEEKKVQTNIGELHYDHLIVANGTRTNYFGNDRLIERAFPLKQIPQALNLRSHLLQNFEKAVTAGSGEEIDALLTVVIVGGGPTGVELAGALGELKKHVLPRDYPELDISKMKIYLMEGQGRLLAGMPEESGRKAEAYLAKFDVDVRLETMVKDYDGHVVVLDNGDELSSETLVWAAGVKGSVLPGFPEEVVKGNRLQTDEFHRVEGLEDVFAVGDIAMTPEPDFPDGHPQLAPVAIQQGKNLARNMLRRAKDKTERPFRFRDKGTMATVGRNRAVVHFPNGWNFGGVLAWWLWMFVHLMSIIGFRNRLIVLSNWVWNYATYDRGTRLIIRPFVPGKTVMEEDSTTMGAVK